MAPYFEVVADPYGYFHLVYLLKDTGGEFDSYHLFYRKVDQEGETIVGPEMLFFEDSTNVYSGRICLDEEENVHLFGGIGEDYYYMQKNLSGETTVEPTVINGLFRPWYGGFLSKLLGGAGGTYFVRITDRAGELLATRQVQFVQ